MGKGEHGEEKCGGIWARAKNNLHLHFSQLLCWFFKCKQVEQTFFFTCSTSTHLNTWERPQCNYSLELDSSCGDFTSQHVCVIIFIADSITCLAQEHHNSSLRRAEFTTFIFPVEIFQVSRVILFLLKSQIPSLEFNLSKLNVLCYPLLHLLLTKINLLYLLLVFYHFKSLWTNDKMTVTP